MLALPEKPPPLPLSDNPLMGADQPAGIETPQIGAVTLRRQITKRTLKHLTEVANAATQIDRIPEPDEAVHTLMTGDFHGWDLVPALLKLAAPETINRLYVATLGFNKQNANELMELLDSFAVGSVVFVCSHYFRGASPAEYEILRAGLVSRGQTIAAVRSHAKVIALELTDSRCIVSESSANLRSCRNIEQLCLTQSRELFEFHAQWITQVCRHAQKEDHLEGDRQTRAATTAPHRRRFRPR